MKKTIRTTFATAAAALLVLASGAAPAAAQTPVAEGISDERVLELARGYADLLFAGDYEALWEHVSPEGKARFGTLEAFRSGGQGVMSRLGEEKLIVSENVEPATAGMIATKVYLRVSHYSGAEGSPVRLIIGLKDDGTIGGIAARPAQ